MVSGILREHGARASGVRGRLPRGVRWTDAWVGEGGRGNGMARISIVEDDAALREQVRMLLGHDGYEVVCVDVLGDVVAQVVACAPDLVLLDLTLPGKDGQAVCRELRQVGDVPIIVMTSRDNDLDELLALKEGADDFIAKPFNPQVFLAHVAAQLRRAGGAAPSAVLRHAGVELDTMRGTVSFGGATAGLARNEMLLLAALMRDAGSIVTRSALADALWQTDQFVDDNTLTVNITRLRSSLSAIGVPEGFLQTRRGMGYVIA